MGLQSEFQISDPMHFLTVAVFKSIRKAFQTTSLIEELHTTNRVIADTIEDIHQEISDSLPVPLETGKPCLSGKLIIISAKDKNQPIDFLLM